MPVLTDGPVLTDDPTPSRVTPAACGSDDGQVNEQTSDLVAELAELFGPDPEELDDDLLDELCDELGARTDTEVALVLLGLLIEVATEWPAQLARCERCLGAVADRTVGAGRRTLRSGVDLMLGLLAAEQERWDEAAVRLPRAYPALDPTVFGDQLGDCENALGEIAFVAGDAAAARRYFEAALDHYPADAELPAAGVTGRLAELAELAGDRVGAGRLYGRVADLLAAAGVADGAVEAAEHGCRLTLAHLRGLPDHGDTAAPFAVAREARELAVRYGVRWAAVELLTSQAIFGADQGVPWDRVHAWFDQARREAGEVPARPEQNALFRAAIDMSEGNAAISRGMPVQAEGPLRAALAVFRAQGRTVEVAACERLLIGVRGFFEPDVARPARDAAGRDWADPESSAAALTVQAVGALRQERPDAAAASLGEARELLGDDEARVLAVDALAAWQARGAGDAEPARRCLRRIDEWRGAGPETFRGAVEAVERTAGMLRAALALRDGEDAAATSELTRLETGMRAAGAGLFAAQVAVGRGIGLLDRGDAAGAARVLVPAVLALDAVRFTLDDAERRALWSAPLASAFGAALRAAAASGDVVLLAELIEVARANAIPTPRPGDAAPALDELLGDPGADTPGTPVTLAGPAVLGGTEHRTVLGVPAQLRTPWGTLALADHIEAARSYHEPIRAAEVAEWTVA